MFFICNIFSVINIKVSMSVLTVTWWNEQALKPCSALVVQTIEVTSPYIFFVINKYSYSARCFNLMKSESENINNLTKDI